MYSRAAAADCQWVQLNRSIVPAETPADSKLPDGVKLILPYRYRTAPTDGAPTDGVVLQVLARFQEF